MQKKISMRAMRAMKKKKVEAKQEQWNEKEEVGVENDENETKTVGKWREKKCPEKEKVVNMYKKGDAQEINWDCLANDIQEDNINNLKHEKEVLMG